MPTGAIESHFTALDWAVVIGYLLLTTVIGHALSGKNATTVTGMPMDWCILCIGAFAVIWTLMSSMRTVIWTDVIPFMIFLLGGLLALAWWLTPMARC